MFELDDGNHAQTLLFQFLDCGHLTLAFLLPIERDGDRDDLGAMGLDQRDGFANGGTGGNDVVDDHHATANFGANDTAALAVIFGFLAIECIGEVALMKLEQCAGGDRRQWNALVGGTEQQIEVDF